jgi:hypothetical protein
MMVRGELLGSHWSLLSTLRRADHLTGCVGHARNSERLDSLAPAHFGPLGSTHLCRTHPSAPFASGRCGRPRQEPGQPPTPHRPSDWARSQAAFAIRAMTLSRVASSAEESQTNAATTRCRPSGSVIMPMSLVAEDDWLAALRQVHRITKKLRFALLCFHHNNIMGTLS